MGKQRSEGKGMGGGQRQRRGGGRSGKINQDYAMAVRERHSKDTRLDTDRNIYMILLYNLI